MQVQLHFFVAKFRQSNHLAIITEFLMANIIFCVKNIISSDFINNFAFVLTLYMHFY